MRRFAAWLFSDWRLAIVLPLIVASVFAAGSYGGSLFTAIEASQIDAWKARYREQLDHSLRETKPS